MPRGDGAGDVVVGVQRNGGLMTGIAITLRTSRAVYRRLIISVWWFAAIALLVVTVNAAPALAGCPTGTYEWVDDWGNRICKSFDTGDTRTIEGSTKNCPTGTYRWIDSWGNPICKAYQGDAQYYDTSKGCPTGTYQWVDEWGHKVCKRF